MLKRELGDKFSVATSVNFESVLKDIKELNPDNEENLYSVIAYYCVKNDIPIPNRFSIDLTMLDPNLLDLIVIFLKKCKLNNNTIDLGIQDKKMEKSPTGSNGNVETSPNTFPLYNLFKNLATDTNLTNEEKKSLIRDILSIEPYQRQNIHNLILCFSIDQKMKQKMAKQLKSREFNLDTFPGKLQQMLKLYVEKCMTIVIV